MSEKEVKVKFSTLYILPRALKRIMYYAKAADGEVSGLGTIKKAPDGRYIVDEVYLLEQESSAADTELNPESISTLMTDMMKKNEDPSKLKFWWHSHSTMGVFWSGTDDTCAETLSREFAFSLVVNKAGESLCRLDIYNPIRITFNHIKLQEIIEEDAELKTLCELEVKSKVKTPSFGYQHNSKGATGGYLYGGREPGADAYDEYYGGYGYGGRGWDKKKENTKIFLSEDIVNDIERFITIATANASKGGSLAPATWEEFTFDTLKEVLEKKFEKKSSCRAFATWDEQFTACGGSCKVTKLCKHWTKLLEKKSEAIESQTTEADAATEIENESNDLNQNTILE